MKDASKVALVILLAIPKRIMLILVVVLWYLPSSCFRRLPSSLKSKVRVGRHYAFKRGLGVEQKAELEITELKDMYKQSRRKKGPRYQGGSGEASPLSNFLGIYDILIIVSGDLHYSDILNLSRVSKSVRESVLPEHDFDRRIIMFQRYSCSATTKTFCWICHKQMCDVNLSYSTCHPTGSNFLPGLSKSIPHPSSHVIPSPPPLPSVLHTMLSDYCRRNTSLLTQRSSTLQLRSCHCAPQYLHALVEGQHSLHDETGLYSKACTRGVCGMQCS
jgi:hypothetical protein